MRKEELKSRTKQFALQIILLIEDLPNTIAGQTIENQIIRSGTSVAANYHAACRARSNSDFISKITVVEEESDETLFWLELIVEANLIKKEKLLDMLKEADELTAIFTASGKTTRLNNPQSTIRYPKSIIFHQICLTLKQNLSTHKNFNFRCNYPGANRLHLC